MAEPKSDKPDLTPFSLQGARISLTTRNAATAYGASESRKMDFKEYDRADEDTLNRILWHSIKGRSAQYPAPVRRAVPAANRLPAAGSKRDVDD